MLCADENFFPWIDICAIQINKYYIIIIIIIIIIKIPVWEQQNIPSLGQGSGGREEKKPEQTGQISASKSIPAVVWSQLASLANFFFFFPQCGAWSQAETSQKVILFIPHGMFHREKRKFVFYFFIRVLFLQSHLSFQFKVFAAVFR